MTAALQSQPLTKASSELTFPIFMDYQSTTPLDPRALEAMLPYFSEKYGNPHSRSHAYGWEAEEATEIAREQVASLLNASPKEVIFTSGATESNNLAIKGVGRPHRTRKPHVVTVSTEHKCVLESCLQLEREGHRVTYLPVQGNGLVNLEALKAAITDETALVSVMAVNNEIGVIQPLAEIGAICRERGVYFHTDAAQAFGKIPLDVNAMSIDLLSISGHKIYGPKGVGALYVRRRPRVRLEPVIHGGGQERGLRAGTLPTPLVVGLGEASCLAAAQMAEEAARIHAFSDRFLHEVVDTLPGVRLNGDREQRLPGCLNVSFAGIEGESLIMALKELAVSSASACSSASLEPSYVLRALGVDETLAQASIRFGMGRFTCEEEVAAAIGIVQTSVQRLREAAAGQAPA